MSEGYIVLLCISGMALVAFCFIVYIGINSDIKQTAIIKEVIQEAIKHEKEKDTTND